MHFLWSTWLCRGWPIFGMNAAVILPFSKYLAPEGEEASPIPAEVWWIIPPLSLWERGRG